MSQDQPIRVALYLRVSTNRQADTISQFPTIAGHKHMPRSGCIL